MYVIAIVIGALTFGMFIFSAIAKKKGKQKQKKELIPALLIISSAMILAVSLVLRFGILGELFSMKNKNYGVAYLKPYYGNTFLYYMAEASNFKKFLIDVIYFFLNYAYIFAPLCFISAVLVHKFPIASLLTALFSGITLVLAIVRLTYPMQDVIMYVIMLIGAGLLGLIASAKVLYDNFMKG